MYYFIINPVSSSGNGMKVWERAEKLLKKTHTSYEAFILSRPGEATILASRLSRHAPCTIVSVGGDGTINEIINGIRNFDQVTFASIPTGSGNDFGRGLKLPSSPEAMLRCILHPVRFARINIGTVSNGKKMRRFAVSAGIGFDAEICYGVSRSRLKPLLNKFHAGKLTYTFIALKQLLTMKRQPLRIVVDGSRLISCQNAYFTSVMNLPFEGGGYQFCPKARPNDDQLDLCIVDGLPRIIALLCFPVARIGKHTNINGIQIVRCRRATIQNKEPLCVHVDGEHFGFCNKITVQTQVHKLTVITG